MSCCDCFQCSCQMHIFPMWFSWLACVHLASDIAMEFIFRSDGVTEVTVLVCFHCVLLWTLILSSPCSSWPYKRFLRCSPFDEFSLWKSQVDNGSMKGGERLSILTRSLLLRRTKDQLDSTGKPLVTRFLPIPSEAREGGWSGPQVDQPCIRSLSLLRRPSLEQSFPGKGAAVQRLAREGQCARRLLWSICWFTELPPPIPGAAAPA